MANPAPSTPPNPHTTGSAQVPAAPSNLLVAAFKGDTLSASLAGWGIIFVVLMFLASFDSTSGLAAAFSWLILAAVLLLNGETIYSYYTTPTKAGG